jgi:hypothetical protein
MEVGIVGGVALDLPAGPLALISAAPVAVTAASTSPNPCPPPCTGKIPCVAIR